MPMRPVAKIIPPMKLGPSKRFPLCGAAVVGRDAVVVCGCTVVVVFVGAGGDGGIGFAVNDVLVVIEVVLVLVVVEVVGELLLIVVLSKIQIM